MIKQLLSLATVALLTTTANAATLDLSLSDLGSGWGSSYDAATKTITYEAAWSGRGWWLTDADYSKYDEVVVEFETSTFDVKGVVEYNNDITSTEAMATAGKTKIVIPLSEEGKASVKQIYLQNSAVGTLTLTAAYLQNKEVLDLTKNVTLWTGDQTIDWWADAVKISISDFIAAEPQVGDKLAITVESAATKDNPDGGSIKVQLLKADWTQEILPGFENLEGYSAAYNTVFVPAGDKTVEIVLSEADVKQLTDASGNQSVMIVGDGITVKKVEIARKAVTTGIADITVEDANAPVEYFNLQGIRVNNPENGIFIRRQGKNVTKVIVK